MQVNNTDDLNTLRGFVGVLQGYMGSDQSLAYTDGSVVNRPGQYQTVGQYGASVEGMPVSTMQNGAVVISPMLIMLALGAAAAWAWAR